MGFMEVTKKARSLMSLLANLGLVNTIRVLHAYLANGKTSLRYKGGRIIISDAEAAKRLIMLLKSSKRGNIRFIRRGATIYAAFRDYLVPLEDLVSDDTLFNIVYTVFIAINNPSVLSLESINDIAKLRFYGRTFLVPRELAPDFVAIIGFELLSGLYDFLNRHNVIIDVGGFLGETAWYYFRRGFTRKIIVYEPVYYEFCLNNIGDIAKVYPYAVSRHSRVKIEPIGVGSRLSSDQGKGMVVDAVTFEKILDIKEGDIALKIDCEGCEEYLLDLPCSILGKANEYIVEIHPWINTSYTDIVKHFKNCDFKVKEKTIKIHRELGMHLYHFYK